jgi:hypothetical protein
LSADYKTRFEGKDESPESKLALANVQQVIDRMIDAYARAVALAGTDPNLKAKKAEWLDSATTWYKYRHNGADTGLTDLIASVMSKPLPPEPTPLTTLPATTTPAASTTPGSGNMTTTGSTAAPATTNKAATGAPAATTAPKTTAETATTKPAAKPKVKNNHRRH